MVSIFFDADISDRKRLKHLHEGHLFIYSPSALTIELCDYLRADTAAPGLAQSPRAKACIRAVVATLGCDPECTYIAPARARDLAPRHPHREIWFAAPTAQITWFLTPDETDGGAGITFFPEYWERSIANTSRSFNYYRRGTSVHPHADEPLDLERYLRPNLKAGSLVLFSAAHLHAHDMNFTQAAPRGIDFRTVNIEDITAHRGACNPDARPTGTSLRDFAQARDGRHFAEELVEEYDDTPPSLDRQTFRSPHRIIAN